VIGAMGGGQQMASAGTPLVVVKFDHPDVDYQQILYAALNQALQNRPGANFQVVAVSPTPRYRRLGADRPVHRPPPCPGRDALHDRHGCARDAAERGLHHRPVRHDQRSARVRALIF